MRQPKRQTRGFGGKQPRAKDWRRKLRQGSARIRELVSNGALTPRFSHHELNHADPRFADGKEFGIVTSLMVKRGDLKKMSDKGPFELVRSDPSSRGIERLVENGASVVGGSAQTHNGNGNVEALPHPPVRLPSQR